MRPILVTGATGKQGGAVVSALLASPQVDEFLILAVTRNIASTSAKRLADKKNVKLVQGDLNDAQALLKSGRAIAGSDIWGIFSVQAYPLTGKGSDPNLEIRQGNDLIDAAIATNVSFFVYSSVDRGGAESINNPTPVPHFSTKHTIEQHLFSATTNSSMKWAVMRPVTFMENLTPDITGKTWATMFNVYTPTAKMFLISTIDVGRFAAQCFLQPDKWAGQSVSLCSDKLTFDEVKRIFKDKTEKDLPTIPRFAARGLGLAMAELPVMFKWFQSHGYNTDMQKSREDLPGMLTFGAWVESRSPWKRATAA